MNITYPPLRRDNDPVKLIPTAQGDYFPYTWPHNVTV